MADFDADAFNEAAQHTISQLVSCFDSGAMVTRYVLIAETLGQDGERAVVMSEPLGQKPWDTAGLLHWAAIMEDDEDDE